MVYLAAGWAFIVTLLLLASEPTNQTPFIITLILLVIMFSLRTYFHFKESDEAEALLDVVLSILLTAVSTVFLVSILQVARLYVGSWEDFLNPVVLMYVGLNIVLLVPFVIFSLIALYKALRHLRKEKVKIF